MKLPRFEDLDREQDLIYDLDLEGSYLISGPPGTGKSVMAMYRAKLFKEAGEDFYVLTYGRVLTGYMRIAAAQLGLEKDVSTFHSWFPNFYKRLTGGYPPKVSKFDFDWPSIVAQLARRGIDPSFQNLLIDEAQDLPTEVFGTLRDTCQNLNVFADENQQIFANGSTLDDIALMTDIPESNHYRLTKNHRNTRQIAELAAFFHTSDEGLPALPDRQGDLPTVRRFSSEAETIAHIAMFAASRTDREIGVLLKRKKAVERYASALRRTLGERVQHYTTDEQNALSFGGARVTVLTDLSAKGLEFDAVFIPELERHAPVGDDPDWKRKLYVMVSRARDELHLLWKGAAGAERPPALSLIPDQLILEV